ncbi:MAG: alpha/beta fold hydrolase [Planctomycetales bacterium]|nr:alpha/beta fold hydrolase [Planctomycetales bacterium]
MTRISHRVSFIGGNQFDLAGILDSPTVTPKAYLVFTHCFTCTKDIKVAVRVGRGLVEHGYAVLRYDLTGLGDSQGHFAHTNFTTNQADLLAAVGFLEIHHAAPKFLIGHSFGGLCSLSLAEQLPSVKGVVTLAAPSDTKHLANLLSNMNPQIEQQGQGSVRIGGRDHSIHHQMLMDFRQHDISRALRQLTKPTLLIHSLQDETLGYEHVLRLFGLLTQRAEKDPPPSASSLVCLPHADHLLTSHPADLKFVVNTIAVWFDRLLADE